MNELLSIQDILIRNGIILDSSIYSVWSDYTQLDREIRQNKFRFPKSQIYDELDRDCPICLETIVKGHIVVQLDCNHIYHCNCINCWKQNSCPYCRETIDSRADVIMRLNSDID